MGKVRMGMMNQDATKGALGLGERQALAALGQLRLIALWDSLFGQLGISVAQVLLTRNDIADVSESARAKSLQRLLIFFPLRSDRDSSTQGQRFKRFFRLVSMQFPSSMKMILSLFQNYDLETTTHYRQSLLVSSMLIIFFF